MRKNIRAKRIAIGAVAGSIALGFASTSFAQGVSDSSNKNTPLTDHNAKNDSSGLSNGNLDTHGSGAPSDSAGNKKSIGATMNEGVPAGMGSGAGAAGSPGGR